MGVNASATGDKKKKPVSNQNTREVQDDDEDSGDEAEEIKREYWKEKKETLGAKKVPSESDIYIK